MTPSDPELTVALVDSDVRDAYRVTAMADDHICRAKTSAGKRRWTGVHQRNDPTLSGLCADGFGQMPAEALEVLDTDTCIPYPGRRGEYLYDFWRNAQHPRGVWRRTTLEQTGELQHRMLNNTRQHTLAAELVAVTVEEVDHPLAMNVLVWGILGVRCCGAVGGPIAWIRGRRVLRDIAASSGTMGGRSAALGWLRARYHFDAEHSPFHCGRCCLHRHNAQAFIGIAPP